MAKDDEFSKAKDILAGAEEAEAAERNTQPKSYRESRVRETDDAGNRVTITREMVDQEKDWEDVNEYRRDRYLAGRIKLLDKLVPKRICPRCGKFFPSRMSWVVNKQKTIAVCRSCFSKVKDHGWEKPS